MKNLVIGGTQLSIIIYIGALNILEKNNNIENYYCH